MKLTRRDALGALFVGGGVGVGVSQLSPSAERQEDADGELTTDAVQSLISVAEVVYPSAVTPTDEFVETYVSGLPPSRQRIVAETVQGLERYARREFGKPFRALSQRERDAALRSMGVDRVGSDPDGSLPERIRYYVVNQLLYGLYTSPTGSSLVGIENPTGYAGGYESYQKPPNADATSSEP